MCPILGVVSQSALQSSERTRIFTNRPPPVVFFVCSFFPLLFPYDLPDLQMPYQLLTGCHTLYPAWKILKFSMDVWQCFDFTHGSLGKI